MHETTNEPSWDEVLAVVFQEHYKLLYTEAHYVIKNEQDAEDLVQELYLKLAEGGFNAQIRSNPKAYLRQAIKHDALDLLRSRKRRKKDPALEDVELAAPGSERADENIRDQLEMALSSMTDEVREIVTLHCRDGYSDSEIAEMRGET